MLRATIIDALYSPKLFGALSRFKTLSTWTAWLLLLKAIFGLPITDQELELFYLLTKRRNPAF